MSAHLLEKKQADWVKKAPLAVRQSNWKWRNFVKAFCVLPELWTLYCDERGRNFSFSTSKIKDKNTELNSTQLKRERYSFVSFIFLFSFFFHKYLQLRGMSFEAFPSEQNQVYYFCELSKYIRLHKYKLLLEL